MNKLLFVFTIIGMAAWAGPALSQAAISVTPAITEIATTPGEAVNTQFTIKNATSAPLQLEVEVLPYLVDRQAETQTANLCEGAEIEPAITYLDTRRAKIVQFTLRIPSNVEPRSYYCTVLFKPTTSGIPEAGDTVINGYVGTVVGLSVFGDDRLTPLPVQIVPSHALLETTPSSQVSVQITNPDIDFYRRGELQLLDIQENVLDRQGVTLLPKEKRSFDFNRAGSKLHIGLNYFQLRFVNKETLESTWFGVLYLPPGISLAILLIVITAISFGVIYRQRVKLALQVLTQRPTTKASASRKRHKLHKHEWPQHF